MHPGEGEIRAYLDQALGDSKSQAIKKHLESCAACRDLSTALQNRAQWIDTRLSNLTIDSPEILPAASARSHFKIETIHDEENNHMFKNIFRQFPRWAWITVAVILILGVALAFDPVRAIANSFLGLFRVEQVRVVEIDPENLPQALGNSSNLEYILSENVQFDGQGENQEVEDAAQASALAGIPLRLPTNLEDEPTFIVQPGGSATLNVDMDLVNAVLQDIGRSDIQLPEELDGAAIRITIPTAVAAQFGDCDIPALDQPPLDPDTPVKLPPVEPNNCITLLQMSSPAISGPPELDINQIGEAYLQLLGMGADEAAQFARNVDWTTTFVVPIPRYGVEYQEVTVDGVKGTLISQPSRNLYALVWVKDGILYSLGGTGDPSEGLLIAAALE